MLREVCDLKKTKLSEVKKFTIRPAELLPFTAHLSPGGWGKGPRSTATGQDSPAHTILQDHGT